MSRYWQQKLCLTTLKWLRAVSESVAHDPISPSFMKDKWGDQTISVLYYHTKWRSFSVRCVTEREFVQRLRWKGWSSQSIDMSFTKILTSIYNIVIMVVLCKYTNLYIMFISGGSDRGWRWVIEVQTWRGTHTNQWGIKHNILKGSPHSGIGSQAEYKENMI